MKRILLSLSLLTLTLQANSQTQIGNSNFEAWDNVGQDEVEPTNWNSFMNATTTFWTSLAKAKQLDRTTDIRPGSTGTYSVKIYSRSVAGVVANGNITLGKINAGSITATDPANYNSTITGDNDYSESFNDTPDSIVVWVKYIPANISAGHQARISSMIHTNVGFKDPNDTLSTTTLKAKATSAISYTGGNWQRIALKFTDVNASLTSSYILVTFATNKTPGGGSANDQLFIDDLQLVYIPKASFTASGASVCEGGSLNFTNTSTNYPATYSWNFGDGTAAVTTANASHTFATAGTYNVVLTATNQWGSKASSPFVVTVNNQLDATFSYSNATYCSNAGNQTPTVVDAGTFTATPAGLSINSTTGVVDLAASTTGTYTVTNTASGACPDTKTTSITINPAANSSFNYPSNTICISDGDQTPTTAEAGTFSSSPAGLAFVSTTTGVIDVSNSTAGTYTITHSVAGTCPSTTNVNVTLTSTPDASFTYAQGAYCADATDPAPVFGTGASGGVFSASPSGLSINSNSGLIDLSASTAGTYTVTNDIAAVGTCAASSEVFTVVVNALPNVTLAALTDVCIYHNAFTLTGGAPAGGTYSGTGVTAGSFDPATAGLGTKTITYSYTDPNNCSNTATNTILVDDCLGLEDNKLSAVAVYPNPTDGKLTLSGLSEETAFKVISVSGQVVVNGKVSSTADTVDLSAFENGIYVLQLTQGQAIQTIRIIKK
ncbi:T9SS type A sorting domain-containing protein [Fluviicola sp.]|uniref:T9SS type A sorting domain-containing protein n=1 Tax=Fluviicola sp. TaxID=1917219 RepID=UPI00261C87B5|nr:T9SS type A sorting domain-containing protein [Fluviicola sp.]